MLVVFLVSVDAGGARVRFRRSDANSDLTSGLAAHRPLSWASERATMCSVSVSLMLSNQVPV